MFKTFLNEAADPNHVGHLTHFEDAGHESGHQGTSSSLAALTALHNHIKNGKHDSNLTTKVDGGVSFVAGHHPKTKKPFVAYKGAIGKIGTDDEKGVLHSHAQIDKHFKDKPYLKDKMHTILSHAHKILPKQGIYQGDLLHAGEHDKKISKGKVSVTPNTISYSAKRNSPEGEKLEKSKVGVAFHTKYEQSEDGKLKAQPVSHSDFKHHDDVYNLSTSNDSSKAKLSAEDSDKFNNHLNTAHDIHKIASHRMYNDIRPLSAHISTHINRSVREGSIPSTNSLVSHVHEKLQKDIDSKKTEKGKAVKEQQRQDTLNHIKKNSKSFDNYFNMHHHIEKAKEVLVHSLNKADHPLEHHIGDKKTSPEGYVFYHHGKPFKAVDRQEFAKANFAKSRD